MSEEEYDSENIRAKPFISKLQVQIMMRVIEPRVTSNASETGLAERAIDPMEEEDLRSLILESQEIEWQTRPYLLKAALYRLFPTLNQIPNRLCRDKKKIGSL